MLHRQMVAAFIVAATTQQTKYHLLSSFKKKSAQSFYFQLKNIQTDDDDLLFCFVFSFFIFYLLSFVLIPFFVSFIVHSCEYHFSTMSLVYNCFVLFLSSILSKNNQPVITISRTSKKKRKQKSCLKNNTKNSHC